MTLLLCFLGGIIFIVFVLPVLQSLAEVVITLCESTKSELHVKITKNNVKITKLNAEIESEQIPSVGAIGFDAVNPEAYYDYEDDDDDDGVVQHKPKSKSKRNPIGF